MQQRRQLFALQFGKCGHAAFALVDEGDDLRVGHLVVDSLQRRKGWQYPLALIAMADGAMVRVSVGAGLLCGSAGGRLGWLDVRGRIGRSRIDRQGPGLNEKEPGSCC